MYLMDASHLTYDELVYEFRIRNLEIPHKSSDKIMDLNHILLREAQGLAEIPSCMPFLVIMEVEVQICVNLVKHLGAIYEQCESRDDRKTVRELVSRLIHLEDRLSRIECKSKSDSAIIDRILGETRRLKSFCVAYVEGSKIEGYSVPNFPSSAVSNTSNSGTTSKNFASKKPSVKSASSYGSFPNLCELEESDDDVSECTLVDINPEVTVRKNSVTFDDILKRKNFDPRKSINENDDFDRNNFGPRKSLVVQENDSDRDFERTDPPYESMRIQELTREIENLKKQLEESKRDKMHEFNNTNPFFEDLNVPRSTGIFLRDKHNVTSDVCSNISNNNSQVINSSRLNRTFCPSNWPKELKFSGTNDSVSIQQFLKEVLTFAYVNEIDNQQLCACAYYFLTGTAKLVPVESGIIG